LFTAAGLPPGHLYYDCVEDLRAGARNHHHAGLWYFSGTRLDCGGEQRFTLMQSPQHSLFLLALLTSLVDKLRVI